MNQSNIRMIIADDHKVMCDGLKLIFDKQPDIEVIGIAHTGKETINIVQENEPDVVLLDINMPDMTGIEVSRQIKSIDTISKILAFSVHIDHEFIAQMIKAGASGYIPKNSDAIELIEAVRTVMRGQTYISPEIADSIFDYIQLDDPNKDIPFTELTMREKEVLQYVVEGKSTKEISSLMFISDSTVESHRKKILKKLNLHNIAELTKYAIRQGLTSLDH